MTENTSPKNLQENHPLPKEGNNEFRIAQENWTKRYEFTFCQLQGFSLAAMKAPALASAGGIAAVLGFYSANYSELSKTVEKLEHFNLVLFWWPLALMITVILPGIAFLSQNFYVISLENETYNSNKSQYEENKTSLKYRFWGNSFKNLAIFFVVVSYVCMILGGYEFWLLVT